MDTRDNRIIASESGHEREDVILGVENQEMDYSSGLSSCSLGIHKKEDDEIKETKKRKTAKFTVTTYESPDGVSTLLQSQEDWNELDDCNVLCTGHEQLLTKITIPQVSPIPRVTAWDKIPFNYHERDAECLSHLPSLEEMSEKKANTVIKQLKELHGGKMLHDQEDDEGQEEPCNNPGVFMDDEALYDTIQAMIRWEADKGPTFTHQDESASGNEELNSEDIDWTRTTSDCDYSDPSRSNSLPSKGICFSLASTYCELGSPAEIWSRYEKIAKDKKGITDELKAESNSGRNIDDVEAIVKFQPKEKTMCSYRILFCRRCLTYDCRRHTQDELVTDLKHFGKQRITINPPLAAGTTSMKTPVKAGTSCGQGQASKCTFRCPNPNCYQLNEEELEAVDTEEILAEWNPYDRSFLASLVESYSPNVCFIAHLMMTRTCNQVKKYIDVLGKDLVEQTKETSVTPLKKSQPSSKKLQHWVKKMQIRQAERKKKTATKLPSRYLPCIHENGGHCGEGASCSCSENHTSCEKFCTCPPTCPYRFPGCKCQGSCNTRLCPCFSLNRECDPDLCRSCKSYEDNPGIRKCVNVGLQKRLHKHVLMGKSDISGWGVFAKDDIQKGELVVEMRGAIISHDESERRGFIYDLFKHTFLFDLDDHFVLDSTVRGNKARFINSSRTPNCEPRRMQVNGDHQIGIYAKRNINAGEELTYNYENVLKKHKKSN